MLWWTHCSIVLLWCSYHMFYSSPPTLVVFCLLIFNLLYIVMIKHYFNLLIYTSTRNISDYTPLPYLYIFSSKILNKNIEQSINVPHLRHPSKLFPIQKYQSTGIRWKMLPASTSRIQTKLPHPRRSGTHNQFQALTPVTTTTFLDILYQIFMLLLVVLSPSRITYRPQMPLAHSCLLYFRFIIPTSSNYFSSSNRCL